MGQLAYREDVRGLLEMIGSIVDDPKCLDWHQSKRIMQWILLTLLLESVMPPPSLCEA
jgi:hypothetical protein